MGSRTRSRPRLAEPGVFAQVYRDRARPLLIFFARRVFDPETALDLTAETFAEAFASRKRFRGTTDPELEAWLFGIARHVLARFMRDGRTESRALARLGVEVPALEPEDIARIVELSGLQTLRDAVARELGALPEAHREAVRLRVVEELPYAEVARRLEITEATARARVSRGVRAVANGLDPAQRMERSLA